jgi:hypothetical protein
MTGTGTSFSRMQENKAWGAVIDVLEYWFHPTLQWEASTCEVRVVGLRLKRHFFNFINWHDESPTNPREKLIASLMMSCIRRHSDVTVPLSMPNQGTPVITERVEIDDISPVPGSPPT